jgi:hypothetical protein
MGKSLKEQIEVMTHYMNGGKVQCKEYEEYVDFAKGVSPTWNWREYDYRIVEEKKTITIEKWLCKDLSRDYSIVIETDNIDELLKFNYSESMCKDKLLETYEVEL